LQLLAYVAGHFLNHALGIVSVEAMDALRMGAACTRAWRSSAAWGRLPLRSCRRSATPSTARRVEVRGKTEQLEMLPVEDTGTLFLPSGP